MNLQVFACTSDRERYTRTSEIHSYKLPVTDTHSMQP